VRLYLGNVPGNVNPGTLGRAIYRSEHFKDRLAKNNQITISKTRDRVHVLQLGFERNSTSVDDLRHIVDIVNGWTRLHDLAPFEITKIV